MKERLFDIGVRIFGGAMIVLTFLCVGIFVATTAFIARIGWELGYRWIWGV